MSDKGMTRANPMRRRPQGQRTSPLVVMTATAAHGSWASRFDQDNGVSHAA